jgi:hypothetical protein
MPSFDEIFGQSAPTLPRKSVSFDDIFGAPAIPPQGQAAPSWDEYKQFAPDFMAFDEGEAKAAAMGPMPFVAPDAPLPGKVNAGPYGDPEQPDAFGKDEFGQTFVHPTSYQGLSAEGRELANRLAARDNAGRDDLAEGFKQVYDESSIGNSMTKQHCALGRPCRRPRARINPTTG